MKKFVTNLFNFSLIIIIPIFFCSCSIYIYLDPFKVLYNYESFYDSTSKGSVTTDKDYISTTTFIKNSKNIDYNSFIFGNSRSIFYQIPEWKKYLKENSKCFHFDASGEALYALNKKIEFINQKGNSIDNVLLVLDYATLIQDKPKTGHLGMISPQLVNYSNIFDFHITFFNAFLTPKFLYAFLDFKISDQIKPYMKEGFLLSDKKINYDVITNELRLDDFENLIKQEKYYNKQRLSVFYDRDTTKQIYSPECILENQKVMLSNIKNILDKHNTNLKVIINPLYDQLKLNKKDIAYLENLFGSDNVFDFSGINKFTNDYRNYYEASHYRPHIASDIMKKIYIE